MLSSEVRPSLQHFSTLSHKQQDLRGKNIIGHTVCVLIFSTRLSGTFLVSKIIERNAIKKSIFFCM